MPLSFPHVGTFTYVMESIAREMGRDDIIVPKKPTYKTKQLGAQHSPEWICTPFKMLLGSFIEVLEQGAYELVGTIFVDYCRLGYYTPLYDLILQNMGYDFQFLYLDFSKPFEFIQNMKKSTTGLTYYKTFRAFQMGWIKNRYIDLAEKLLYNYRAVELTKGSSERVAEKAYRLVVETKGLRNVKKLGGKIRQMYKKEVDIDKKANPMKVGIVGELYAVVEPSINMDVARRLNELGVIADTPITFTRWIDIGRRLNFLKPQHFKIACRKAKPYVEYRLGGKTQESIGSSIIYKEEGYNGVVHLYPFTCMPEIITRSIIPQISRDYNLPIISLVLDEHTGEAGLQTRIEAFVDLLEHRKRTGNNKESMIFP